MTKQDRDLYLRVGLTGEDEHIVVAACTEGKGYFNLTSGLNAEQVRQQIDYELDSWRREYRDEEEEARDGERGPSQASSALADSTREAETGS